MAWIEPTGRNNEARKHAADGLGGPANELVTLGRGKTTGVLGLGLMDWVWVGADVNAGNGDDDVCGRGGVVGSCMNNPMRCPDCFVNPARP